MQLPWRNPVAIPQTDEFAEFLQLSVDYSHMSAEDLLSMPARDREDAAFRIGALRTIVTHQVAERRQEILR